MVVWTTFIWINVARIRMFCYSLFDNTYNTYSDSQCGLTCWDNWTQAMMTSGPATDHHRRRGQAQRHHHHPGLGRPRQYQCRPLHRRQAAAARTIPADVHSSAQPRHNNSGADKLMFRRYPAVDLSSPGRLYNVLIITVTSPIVLLFRLAS